MLSRLVVVAASLVACSERSPPDSGGVEAVGRVLDDFHDAAARADEARYFGHLAEDGVFLGTDASERWLPAAFRAYAHPHFAKGKAWSFKATRRAVGVTREGVAWFDEDLETPNLGPARGSGVLVWRQGTWKIQQYNLALTVPNERFDAVKDTIASVSLDATPEDPLADLAWLAGSWLATAADGTTTTLHWSPPRGALMFGSRHDVRNLLTVGYEQLRVEGRKEGVVLVVSARGGDTTELARVARGEGAAFEAREDAAGAGPRRVIYTRGSQGLTIRVEGGAAGDTRESLLVPAVPGRSEP